MWAFVSPSTQKRPASTRNDWRPFEGSRLLFTHKSRRTAVTLIHTTGFVEISFNPPPSLVPKKTPIFVSVSHCVHIYVPYLAEHLSYHTYLAAVAESCSRNIRHYRSWPDARVAPSLLDVFCENLPWHFLISIEQYCRTAPTRRAPTSAKTATRVVGAAPNQTGRGWGEGLL